MIRARHRIITDGCRQRPIEDIIDDTITSIEKSVREALEGWPAGHNTKIHVRVDIERDTSDG